MNKSKPELTCYQLPLEERRRFFTRAREYFSQLNKNMTPDGAVPEMYVGGRPGHNTPLAWAQCFHIVAAQTLLNLAPAHPELFKILPPLRRGQN